MELSSKLYSLKAAKSLDFMLCPVLVGRRSIPVRARACEGCEGSRQITDVASEGASVKSVARSAAR